MTNIPQGDAERKAAPMFRGLLGYFAWACFKIAAHSLRSDRKHNPHLPAEEAPHWRREASTDHPDCIIRHLCDAWGPRPDDFEGDDLDWEEYHLTALAWRSNALLQEFGEAKRGAAPGCRSVFPIKRKLEDLLHPAQKLVLAAKENERQNAILRAGIEAGERIATTVFPPKGDNGHSIHCECREC
jgi:hypothetical protein